MSEYFLKGNLLWSDEAQIHPGVLHISHGKIRSVSASSSDPQLFASTVIEPPSGGVIAPGFIDIQVNGGFGYDLTANPELVSKVAAKIIRFGVTSFLPTVITSPIENFIAATQWTKDAVGRQSEDSAVILGLHFEGPYLAASKKGAHNPKYLRKPSLNDLPVFDPDIVKLVTLAPELPGSIEFINALSNRGIVVGLGHTAATYEQTMTAVNAGATWGTHLFNSMAAIHHRDPGIAVALLRDKRLRLALIADGVHVHPALLDIVVSVKGANGITLISDSMAAAGMPPGEYTLGDLKVIVEGISPRLESGGLAGSVLTMDKAVRNMVNLAGRSPAEALIMAGTTPAEVIGAATKGRLKAGYDADIVILDKELEVVTTIVGGKVVFARESD